MPTQLRGLSYAVRPPTDDADWNRLAARAAHLRFDGRAMVRNQSALLWHSLPVHYADLRTVHLSPTIRGSSRKRRVLVEFDGRVKYQGERGVDVLFGEKRREDAMRRKGWFFERFVWAEIDDLRLIERRVHETVSLAAAAA